MSLLTALLLAASLCSPSASAAHVGGQGSEPDEKVVESSRTIYVPSLPATKDSDDAAPKEAKKSAKAGKAAKEVPRTFPLFVLVESPERPGYVHEGAFKTASTRLAQTIAKKEPTAGVLRVTPFTLANLESVWVKASEKRTFGTAVPSTTMLIVNGLARTSARGEWEISSQDGFVGAVQLSASIKKLAKSLVRDEAAAFSTILLTSFSGAIQCAQFPGSVFGMTAAEAGRNPAAWRVWHDSVQKNGASFPMSAKDWFESWNVTNQITIRRYFFCPYANGKGYLGYKSMNDPPYDNEGVYLEK